MQMSGPRMRVLGWVALCTALRIADAAPDDRFTLQSLRELIATHNVESVQELLAILPAELRAHYTLVFSSRSLQDATLQNPRAILFGTDAQLIITFNGERSQRGYESVETMELAAGSSSFSFREISFSPDHKRSAPQISDANPARCVVCHDNPARPIWDTPPAWPGVYGERYGAGLSGTELRGMRGFLSSQPAHPRYQYLLGASTLADRDRYVADSGASYNNQSIEPPNAQLSTLLATLNVRSILARLAEQPGFAAHLEALLAAAGDSCGSIADFYPPSMHDEIADDFGKFSMKTTGADRRQALGKTMRRVSRADTHPSLAPPTELTALRYVVERSLGVPTQHWTLAFERGSYDLSAPAAAITFEQALYNWLAGTDPELPIAAAYRNYSESDSYCTHLRRISQAKLAAWYSAHSRRVAGADPGDPQTQQNASRSAPPSMLQTCIACHSSDVAPPLPFGTPALLAARLRENRYPHGRLLDEILFRLTPQAGSQRMPRGVDIDVAQQQQLEHYFIELAHPR
jgi:cytochrome c553